MKKLFAMLLVLAMAAALMPGFNGNAVVNMADEESLSIGVTEENVYWNESLAIGCAMDESWYFLTRDEIAMVMGMTQSMLDEDLNKMINESDSFMDMYCLNTENYDTINISVEKLSLVNSLLISEEKYIELATPNAVVALEQAGITEIECSSGEVKFCGEKHQMLHISAIQDGVPLFENMVVVKKGDRVILITVVTRNDDYGCELFENFFRTKK